MAQLHPAVQLLIYLCVLLMVGMPIIAWFVQPRPVTLQSRLWHAGLALLGVASLGLAILARSTWIPPTAIALAMLLCLESMRCELDNRVVRWGMVLPSLGLYLAIQLWFDLAGLRLTWGIIFTSFSLFFLPIWLAVWVYRVRNRFQSRGLIVVLVGLVVVSLASLGRGVDSLQRLQADYIFSFAPMANATIIGFTLFSVLMTFGYLAFTLEKLHQVHLVDVQSTARAEEKSRLAELHAQELEDIIHQRDAMIMLNSRFSAVNSLSIYNSAIVHEISQPLQGVQTIVDKLAIKAEHYAPVLTSDIGAIAKMVEQIASVLAALRKLISAQTPRQELLLLDEVLRDIGPIMKNEASRRSIRFGYECPNAESPLRVQVNRVLFERVLFNLVANALQALAGSRPVNPFVQIQVAPVRLLDMDCVLIRVEDNGTGFPSEVIGAGGKPLITSKAGGAGIGLALARIIVESWRGCLKLSNQSEPGRTGALVEITLPAH